MKTKTVTSFADFIGHGKPKKDDLVLSWGADPEFMLFDFEAGKIVSAIGVLKNDKNTPKDLGDGIKMYADNVLLEASMPPSASIEEFVGMMQKVLQKIQAAIGPRYRIIAKAAHIYDEAELADPKAKEGGCSPNFDVYAKTANLPPNFKGGLRTGSFHIHIGGEMLNTRDQKDNAIKMLDCYVGLSSIVFDTDPTAKTRRELYGRAGEFRPTPYGIEYRVLGPYALRSPETVRMVLVLARTAIKELVRQYKDGGPIDIPIREKLVLETINNNNRDNARSLLGNFLGMERMIDAGKPRSPDLYRDWGLKI